MTVLLEPKTSLSPKTAEFPTTIEDFGDAGCLDCDELVRQITRLIKRETNFGVQEMQVFLDRDCVVLTGYCRTFYTKQLAQEAAQRVINGGGLINRIRVA
ncbi:MAG: BON domain-containing protein [Thermoguttaceae bacterium]